MTVVGILYFLGLLWTVQHTVSEETTRAKLRRSWKMQMLREQR